MKYPRSVLAVLFAVLLAGCAPKQPPKPDPIREDVTIIQKQLLELQLLQNENRAKLEESTAIITTLSEKIRSLEARLTASSGRQKAESRSAAEAPVKKQSTASKKKPAKKSINKVRRQE